MALKIDQWVIGLLTIGLVMTGAIMVLDNIEYDYHTARPISPSLTYNNASNLTHTSDLDLAKTGLEEGVHGDVDETAQEAITFAPARAIKGAYNAMVNVPEAVITTVSKELQIPAKITNIVIVIMGVMVLFGILLLLLRVVAYR